LTTLKKVLSLVFSSFPLLEHLLHKSFYFRTCTNIIHSYLLHVNQIFSTFY
jgi:hypothetical protein